MSKIAFYQMEVCKGGQWAPLPRRVIACPLSGFRKMLTHVGLLAGQRIKRVGTHTCVAATIRNQSPLPNLLYLPAINQLHPWVGVT